MVVCLSVEISLRGGNYIVQRQAGGVASVLDLADASGLPLNERRQGGRLTP